MADFAERLRNIRKNAQLTQLQIADRIGVNKQTISQYERGVRQPDFEKLKALCDCFHVSSDYLLGRSDSPLGPADTKDTISPD